MTGANCFHFQVAEVACREVSRSPISEDESEASVLSFKLDETVDLNRPNGDQYEALVRSFVKNWRSGEVLLPV